MSQTAPAIPFFGDAYLADTRHLSLEEHGAYLQLMMIAWRIEGCCLPDDDARLARMLGCTAAKWRKLKPTVMAFWTLEDGTWKQARLSKERAYVENRRQAQRDKAETKWESASAPVDDDMPPARKRAARLAAARQKGRHSEEEWRELVSLTGKQCVKCHTRGDVVKDHILPIYRGGSDALNNLQPLCIRCNSGKASDDTDYRLSVCKDLFERLPNACRTPAPPPPPPEVSKKGEASPHCAREPAQPVDDAVGVWKEAAAAVGWPTITTMSPARRRSLTSRLREHGLDGWRAALLRARSSPYLGHDPPAWFTFDWIIKSTNFLKLIEGNYDRNRSDQRSATSAWGAARDSVLLGS